MKRTILTMAAIGLSATLYGQGVFIDNTLGGGLVNGAAAGDTINVTLMGGIDAGSLAPIVSLTGGQLLNLGGGFVFDASGQAYRIPGVADNGNASLKLQFWVGSASTFALAAAANALGADSGPYTNPTGGGGVPPTTPPGAMANMPNVTLAPLGIPEPSTLALAGLGAAALLMYRRRTA